VNPVFSSSLVSSNFFFFRFRAGFRVAVAFLVFTASFGDALLNFRQGGRAARRERREREDGREAEPHDPHTFHQLLLYPLV